VPIAPPAAIRFLRRLSRIYDLSFIGDFLGEGTRLTLSAEVQYDSEPDT